MSVCQSTKKPLADPTARATIDWSSLVGIHCPFPFEGDTTRFSFSIPQLTQIAPSSCRSSITVCSNLPRQKAPRHNQHLLPSRKRFHLAFERRSKYGHGSPLRSNDLLAKCARSSSSSTRKRQRANKDSRSHLCSNCPTAKVVLLAEDKSWS